MKFNLIATDRLILREMNPEVYRFLFNNYDDEQLNYFFGLPGTDALREKKRSWQEGLTMYRKSFLYFQILDPATSHFMGWCGYHTWYLPHRRAEIGYGIADDHWKNKGYMKEVIGPVLHFGFEQMNLNRVEAFIGPDNFPSIKLVENAGFKREGRLKEHYSFNGKLEDSIVYGLLREDWLK